MTTREEALDRAAAIIVAGLNVRDSLPPREAAQLCWTPTGPSLDEIEGRIRAMRGLPAVRDARQQQVAA